MKKIINKNNATKASVFDMIPEEYRFEGYQRWMDYARYDWLENPKCEEWDNLIEEEVNGCVPLTFMLCVSVAGMLSGVLEEESIKVHMQNDLQERTAGFFSVACGGKTKETEGQKGHTYMVDKVLTLPEIVGDFMEEHSLVNSVEQVSIGKRAMEWLLQFISKNYTQFLSKDSPKEISNCRGKLENMQTVLLNTDEESGMRLKVTDSEFMKILKEGHFSEKATVLKEWKEMGYLKAQSDRYISRVKIVGDIQVKGYIIQLPVPSNKIGGDGEKDYEEVLEERRKRINKPRQVIKDEYVEDDFFSIDDDDDLDFPEDWK